MALTATEESGVRPPHSQIGLLLHLQQEEVSMKLAISSYSFHRFGNGPEEDRKPDFAALIERCAAWGLDGIELLGVHFESAEPGALYALKQHAFRHGVSL